MALSDNLRTAKKNKNDKFYISLSISLLSYQSDRRTGECASASAQRNGGAV